MKFWFCGWVVLGMLWGTPLLWADASEEKSVPAVAHTPEHVQVYNQGVEAQKAEKYQEAVNLYRRALKLEPHFADAWNNLGFCLRLIAQGYQAEAMQAYQKALSLEKNHAGALEYQGELYIFQGELLKSYANYQELLRLKPEAAKELKELLDQLKTQAQQIP